MDLNGMMDARNADVKMGWPPAIQWCAIRNGQRIILCINFIFRVLKSHITGNFFSEALIIALVDPQLFECQNKNHFLYTRMRVSDTDLPVTRNIVENYYNSKTVEQFVRFALCKVFVKVFEKFVKSS